jgi:phage FluMu protein Com
MYLPIWLTGLTSNYLPSCSRVLLEKLTIPKLVKKCPKIKEIQRLITVVTRAHHSSLHRARWVHSAQFHPSSLRSILILSSHLCLCLQIRLYPWGFPTKPWYAFVFSPLMCYMTCPPRFHNIKRTLNIAMNTWCRNCTAQYLGPQSGAGPTDDTTTPPAVVSTVKHWESHRLATHASCNLATQHQIYPTLHKHKCKYSFIKTH